MAFRKGHKINSGKKFPGRVSKTSFKKGIIPWNKGKKGMVPWNKGLKNWMSEDSKKSMIEKKRGRKNSPESNKKNSDSHKGEKAYQWTGGSYNWKKKQALTRDDYTCQICGMREPEIMVVDHIKPKSIFPELKLCIDNLMTLCPNCHARKTIREKKQKYDRKLYE